MNIIGTGLSGLVGTRVVEILAQKYKFEDISLTTGIDITNKEQVTQKIMQSDAPWLLHFAAKTDVDGCESEKELKEKSQTWNVNVLATQYVADACLKSGKNILYLSTDYVFDGMKDFYTEEDSPNPQSWYAQTKYEGEKIVASLNNSLIVRIASPYCAINGPKQDFVHVILDKLKKKNTIVAPTDQLFTPTFIDDIAQAIHLLISHNVSGIYHVVGSTSLTPFDCINTIANIFDYTTTITKTTHKDYYHDRASRPLHAVIKNDKIHKLGIKMSSFDEGLKKIKYQLKFST